ncbi:MAG: paraquat-inducible protein A, partial [Lewinella sp.]|nr:paraquat-inducible protein A [Lewinella sp.]
TGLSIWSALSRRMPKSGLLRWLMLRAGKWSMADVFVVAVFLAFLAFNNMQAGIETQSRILPGMYFFMAYVLIAVGVSSLMTGTSPDENV